MKRIVTVLFLFVAVQCSAVHILQPGVIVNGKPITKTYFCYDVAEQDQILKRLDELVLQRELVGKQKEEIGELRKAIDEKDKAIKILNEAVVVQKQALDNMTESAMKLSEKFDQVLAHEKKMKEIQQRRDRRNAIKGALFTALSIVGGRYIVTSK